MSGRLEQMQANKDTYLLQEIEELKAVIDRSKSEREAQLESDVEALNKRVYQLEEEIRRKDIQLNLMERKKQQAVAEIQ
jgi:YbbR domain-containing protein